MSPKRQVPPLARHAEHLLAEVYLPRMLACLEQLSPEQIWWRPNKASNSIGNLILHLSGNVRQWVVSGLGDKKDIRQRDREFAEAGPLPRRVLAGSLRRTVGEACRVLRKLSDDELARTYKIQKFQLTGFEAVFHVAEHFSHHAGQIILLTKMLRGRDLKFTRLPGEARKASRDLPAL